MLLESSTQKVIKNSKRCLISQSTSPILVPSSQVLSISWANRMYIAIISINSFIQEMIMKQKQPMIRLQIMILRVLKSIIYNKSFDMNTLLTNLIQILMQTLVRDLPDESLPLDADMFKLKSAAAHLICMLVKSVAKQRPQLRLDITRSLLNYLYKDLQQPVEAGAGAAAHKMPSGYAMYGITVTLCQLGTEVLKGVLSQELPKIAQVLLQRKQSY